VETLGFHRYTCSPCPLALVIAAAAACASGVDDGGFSGGFNPAPTSGASAEDTGTTDAITTVAPTGGGNSGSGDTADGSDSAPADDTSTGSAGDCDPPCEGGELCVAGTCTPFGDSSTGAPGCNEGPGNYDVCLGPGDVVDVSGCGAMGATCITGGDPPIVGVCSVNPCADVCDCPAAPATGNAAIACDAITGGATQFCYLDCSGGETCPDGMLCFGELVCAWPGENIDGTPYGDCINGGPSTCGIDGLCLNDDVMAPTIGVCTQDCGGVAECPASPGGTAPVVCTDVTGDMANECILDCSGGGSCPAGMSCFSSTLCAWN
jgi:hypothetical protein